MSEASSLTERTMRAARWRFSTGMATAALQFMVGILLARLIPPEDFGILALALLFVGFAALFANLGIAPSVIQRGTLTDSHVRVAFTLSSLLGVAVTVLLVASAPLASWIFPTPGLPRVIRVLSLTFVFSGLGATAGALLQRDLDFRTQFVVALVANGGYALVGTALALAGFGVWSLVWAVLTQRFVETCLLLAIVRHSFRPMLRAREAGELTAFGIGFSLNTMMGYLGRTGDNLVVGRWLGPQQLGYYTRAYGLVMLPHDYLGQTATNVLFPAMSGVQEDRARIRRAYYEAVQLATSLSFPVLCGIGVAAPHLIIGLYGSNWAGTILPLQLLTLMGALTLVNGLSAMVVNAVGRPYAVMFRTMVYAVLVVGLGLWGTRWQAPGVAAGVALASTYMYGAMSRLALRETEGTVGNFARAQAPGMVLAASVTTVALAVRWMLVTAEAPDLLILFVLIITCGITVLFTFRLLPRSMKGVVHRHVGAVYRNRLPASVVFLLDRTLIGNRAVDPKPEGVTTKGANPYPSTEA